MFERSCEARSVEDRSRSGRLTVVNQEKVDEVKDFLQIHPRSSFGSVAETPSPLKTATYRITTEYLLLKPYKVRFIQQLYEEDRVKCCCHH